MDNKTPNRYLLILETIFRSKFRKGAKSVEFDRDDISATATSLKVAIPKNLGDVVYAARYRDGLPLAIKKTAPAGSQWIIRPAGRGKYRFDLATLQQLLPNAAMFAVKVPDATPGLIAKYAMGDEQALLAVIRYNRLIDLLTGLTCYSLQNHLRTSVKEMGQIEIDEVYIGVDRNGAHYVLPVQAKGGNDRLSLVQIEQDAAFCKEKLPHLICRPVAAQFTKDGKVALFDLVITPDGPQIGIERHYLLVPHGELSSEEIEVYRRMSN